jgi:acetoacetyl-CoA synthetase
MAVDMLAADELWRHPDPASTPMWHFIQKINEKYGLGISDYQGLYKWSVENVNEFWEEVWHFVGVKASRPFQKVHHPMLRSTCPAKAIPLLSLPRLDVGGGACCIRNL